MIDDANSCLEEIKRVRIYSFSFVVGRSSYRYICRYVVSTGIVYRIIDGTHGLSVSITGKTLMHLAKPQRVKMSLPFVDYLL
jgi:hypothetical protein